MGALKTDTSDCRNILERARETAARVAAAARASSGRPGCGGVLVRHVHRKRPKEDDALMNAPTTSHGYRDERVRCPDERAEAMKAEIDRAKDAGD
ncbi:MAG: hypothetical protein ACLSVD_12590 [Eggerthellaceae bacterium]